MMQPRSEDIVRSLRAFTFGWIGLIPVIGLPFALGAVILGTLNLRSQTLRNHPARRLALRGILLGWLGLVLTIVPGVLIAIEVVRDMD
jgi:hypothetical protein